ncbi:MAG: CBS domain-containing protein, partial [Proteobacteria bacterium]|nr:CBS domain-containing protein [Pseudomonadota bacterium]
MSDEQQDVYFDEALFYAYQGLYFEALERLDSEIKQHNEIDEPELDTLYYHMDDAEFSLGDFELRYRMHHRAGRAISAVLEGAVDEGIRNDAAYRLSRIHFQKSQMDEALLVMTGENLGCVLVIDENKKLQGIITDGDLKRHMGPDLLQKTVMQVMTADPQQINDNILA